MQDYEPLDLSALCNAGTELLGEDQDPPRGSQRFRGLPFQIGPGDAGDGPCFIGLRCTGLGNRSGRRTH